MRTHNITVTENHTRKGKRMNPNSCPLALAIRDNFGATVVSVGRTHGQWHDKEYGPKPHSYQASQGAAFQIQKFDGGGDFEPGVYQIFEVR